MHELESRWLLLIHQIPPKPDYFAPQPITEIVHDIDLKDTESTAARGSAVS
jgi:hypothetical protein